MDRKSHRITVKKTRRRADNGRKNDDKYVVVFHGTTQVQWLNHRRVTFQILFFLHFFLIVILSHRKLNNALGYWEKHF